MRFLAIFALTFHATALAGWLDLITSPMQHSLSLTGDVCNCAGINASSNYTDRYICNNATLGPQLLPWGLPLLSLVSDYDRFGGLSPAEFLAKYSYWNEKKRGGPAVDWRYPEQDGFQLDVNGKSTAANITLKPGFKVDRFGTEYGSFVSAADAPFSQRALPPDALNVCAEGDTECAPKLKDHPWQYHVYEVVRDLNVSAGPIASGFGQPGGGVQFKLQDRIINLVVDEQHSDRPLRPLNLRDIHPGPGAQQKCGIKPVNCECQKPV